MKNNKTKFSSKILNDSKEVEESKDHSNRTPQPQRRRQGQRQPFKPEFSGDNQNLRDAKRHPPKTKKMEQFHRNNPPSTQEPRQKEKIEHLEPMITHPHPGIAYENDTVCHFLIIPQRISDIFTSTTQQACFKQIAQQPNELSLLQWHLFTVSWRIMYCIAAINQLMSADRTKIHLKDSVLARFFELGITIPKVQCEALKLFGSFDTGAGHCCLSNMTEVIAGLIVEITQLADNFGANLQRYIGVVPPNRQIVPLQVTNYATTFCLGHDILSIVSQRRLIRWLNSEADAGRLPNLQNANAPQVGPIKHSMYARYRQDVAQGVGLQIFQAAHGNYHDLIMTCDDLQAWNPVHFTNAGLELNQLNLNNNYFQTISNVKQFYEKVALGIFSDSKIETELFEPSGSGKACQLVVVDDESLQLTVPFQLTKEDYEHGILFRIGQNSTLTCDTKTVIPQARDDMLTARMEQDLLLNF